MPRHHLLGDALRTTTTNDDATLVVDVERSRLSRRRPLQSLHRREGGAPTPALAVCATGIAPSAEARPPRAAVGVGCHMTAISAGRR